MNDDATFTAKFQLTERDPLSQLLRHMKTVHVSAHKAADFGRFNLWGMACYFRGEMQFHMVWAVVALVGFGLGQDRIRYREIERKSA